MTDIDASGPMHMPDAGRTGRGGVLRLAGAVVLVVAAAAVAILPGLWTLTESSAETAALAAARAVLDTADLAAPSILLAPHPAPLAAWLQALAGWIAGTGVDAPVEVLRLPSALAAGLVLVLTFALGRILRGDAAGLWAALLLAATPLFGAIGRSAGPDAMIAAAFLGALVPVASALVGSRDPALPRAILFWVSLAAAVLLGGWLAVLAATIVVAGVSIADRSLGIVRALRPVIGLPVFLLLVALPAALLAATGDTSGLDAFGRSVLTRLVGEGENRALPGVHLLYAALAFWPAAALLPIAAAHLMSRPVGRAAGFLLLALLPGWVLLEAFADKVLADTALLVPVAAVLVGVVVADGALDKPAGWRAAVLGWIAFGGVLSAVGANAGFVGAAGRADPWGIVGAVLVGVVAIAGWRLVAGGRTAAGLVAATVAGIGLSALVFGWLLPQEPDLRDRADRLLHGSVTAVPTALSPAADPPPPPPAATDSVF